MRLSTAFASISLCHVGAQSTTQTQTNDLTIPFGATFPMIGTQALPKQTWSNNIYMGTIMQFNPGAFFQYSNSYSVPDFNANNNDDNGVDQNGNPITNAPTPAPDATGQPCDNFNHPCPTGYYCQLMTGYNQNQQGTCQRQDSNIWNEGAGKFTDSQYYTGLSHPPLILDPDHNGVAPPNSGYSGYGYGYPAGGSSWGAVGSTGGYGYGYGYNGVSGYGGYGTSYGPNGAPLGGQSCAPLPTGAPVCGYKSFTGTCFCDTDCPKKGDCCPDYAQYCGVLSQGYTGSYVAPTPALNSFSPANYNAPRSGGSGQCDPVGQCAGLCGSPRPATGQNGASCYCDSGCALTGDCCCSVAQCPSR